MSSAAGATRRRFRRLHRAVAARVGGAHPGAVQAGDGRTARRPVAEKRRCRSCSRREDRAADIRAQPEPTRPCRHRPPPMEDRKHPAAESPRCRQAAGTAGFGPSDVAAGRCRHRACYRCRADSLLVRLAHRGHAAARRHRAAGLVHVDACAVLQPRGPASARTMAGPPFQRYSDNARQAHEDRCEDSRRAFARSTARLRDCRRGGPRSARLRRGTSAAGTRSDPPCENRDRDSYRRSGLRRADPATLRSRPQTWNRAGQSGRTDRLRLPGRTNGFDLEPGFDGVHAESARAARTARRRPGRAGEASTSSTISVHRSVAPVASAAPESIDRVDPSERWRVGESLVVAVPFRPRAACALRLARPLRRAPGTQGHRDRLSAHVQLGFRRRAACKVDD